VLTAEDSCDERNVAIRDEEIGWLGRLVLVAMRAIGRADEENMTALKYI
jgi:hypothetical protein